MDSTYVDSLRNKLYELEDYSNSLITKKSKDLIQFFTESIYPLWTDLDSGLTSVEKKNSDEEILSMRIRLDACQVKILHTISPHIESTIELMQNENAVNDIYKVISLIERISQNEGSALSILLKQRKHSVQIKQKLNELHLEGEEIYKEFKMTCPHNMYQCL